MSLMEDWQKEAEAKLAKAKRKSAGSVPPCPECHAHDFDFDGKTGRITCKKCGFETYLKVI